MPGTAPVRDTSPRRSHGDTGRVAYDAALLERIRDLVATEVAGGRPITEKRMFGGHAFLVGGHLTVAASGKGGLLLRVDPAQTESLVADPAADRMIMRGRELDGWLHVDVGAASPDDELARWVALGVAYATSLPPKS